ncbi:MAG TPA: endopeptidase La [Spirochaetota bacterium]|nr:endopeptidase La [Spirochaetota bacterium]HPF05155.1 endopeptidase La [Spirochaetota bacterium]HPJ42577.1 endopeptidase La [Spirochaetota bacterium]HPR36260.1 endopeptidase La [Spirochaetota bacterium]HRX47245.1 endopeptidase La [Spirochaetota bacterium]
MDIDDIMSEGGDFSIDAEILEGDLLAIDHVLPDQLYLIPIRYRPIFPGIVTPLIISQGRFTRVIDKVLNDSRTIGLVLIKDDEKGEIEFEDLYKYGTAARVLKKINLPDGGVNVLINSVKRFKIRKEVEKKKNLVAEVEYLEDILDNKKGKIEIKAYTREVLSKLKLLSDNNPLFTEEMKLTMLNVEEPGKIADFVTSILNIDKQEYQDVLETLDVKQRLVRVLHLLHKEMEVMEVQKKIQHQISDKIDRQQREYFLREQLKAIKVELGMEEDERTVEVREMKKKVEELALKGEVLDKINEEIERFLFMEPSSSEYSVAKNYIDTVLSLPWNTATTDSIDLDKAEKILNRDHYGLDDVKKRILEFIALRKIKPDARGSIICLVGPPGVGKTSLGKSIASALNRKFFRMSLGGMRDEAEIKGHRKTYIGAMPGKIIQGLKITKTNNPVFMLDEIDKMGQSFQGDPASALLEVLDPEQNVEFRDYYLDLPFNLSDVLFITTANTLDTIPQVLADRMEIIRLSGYISMEKYEIARKYLLPKQLKMHGLDRDAVKISKDGYLNIISGWAREAGVRNLERNIEKICRKTATLIAKNKKIPGDPLTDAEIREYLGTEVYHEDEKPVINKPGIITGLAWTSLGGAILTIESIAVKSKGGPGLKLTGQLGDVMTESANIAYTYINHLMQEDEAARKIFEEFLVHVHVPEGATPKDGPSAGITMAASIYSMVTGIMGRSDLAMTGELTLSGRVFPIGGLKEKVIAAKRADIKHIIIPSENKKDLEDIPDYVKKGLTFHPVSDILEVLDISFGKKRGKMKR